MRLLSALFMIAIAGLAWQSADPAIYKTDTELMSVLKEKIKATPEAMVDSNIVTDSRYQANIVHRSKPAGAISHPEGTEIHYIIEGSGTMVTGGTFNRTGKTVTIDGGVSRHVAKGDSVVIPAGTPHWYKEVDGSITYLEVRFNVGSKK